MNALRSAWMHLVSQPFIAATGFAALVHSTWTLGTLFSGAQPNAPALDAGFTAWFTFMVATVAWHVPPLAIALAVDIGQIATSHEIRAAVQRGDRPIAKYATFGVFAIATYYLQWVYCMHHFPMVDLGAGVSSVHMQNAANLRDLAVWIVPALLPLSTLMYTLSHSAAPVHPAPMHESKRRPAYRAVHVRKPIADAQTRIDVRRPVAPALPAATAPRANPTGNYTGEAKDAVQRVGEAWIFTCPHCTKVAEYASETSAVKGASAHVGRYCTALKKPVEVNAQ
jgi:hypothetical protein